LSNDINDISEPVSKDNINPMEKALGEIEKKSKKKKIAIVSTIVVLIPVILAVIYAVSPSTLPLTPSIITVEDFPIEYFDQGYQALCIRDQTLSCLIKNDGIIELTHENGIYKFQTRDYSLIKYFSDDIGFEENTISLAFYDKNSMVKHIGTNVGYSMWLVTAKDRQ